MDVKKFGDLAGRLIELVESWKTEGTADPMERDIAMGLLRELYTELRFADGAQQTAPEPESVQEPVQDSETAACPLPSPEPEKEPEPVEEAPAETVQEAESEAVEPEAEPKAELKAEDSLPAPEPAPEKESIPVVPRRVDPGVIRSLYGDDHAPTAAPAREQPAQEPAATPAEEPEIEHEPAKKNPSGTIGEMNGKRQTLGETLQNGKKDMASKIAASERPDLKRSIGINDKFLMIRDMFDGDAGAFETAIAKLDTFGDLDEAVIYIHETYNWNADSDGVKLLVELLERKLG